MWKSLLTNHANKYGRVKGTIWKYYKQLGNTILKSIRLSLIIYSYHSNKGSGVYQISIENNQHTHVYCQMTSVSGCYGGGWTLVMKIDGSSVRLYGGFVKNMQCLQMNMHVYTLNDLRLNTLTKSIKKLTNVFSSLFYLSVRTSVQKTL